MPIMIVVVSGEARGPQTQQLKHNYHPGRPSSGCQCNAFCFTGCIMIIRKSFVKKNCTALLIASIRVLVMEIMMMIYVEANRNTDMHFAV